MNSLKYFGVVLLLSFNLLNAQEEVYELRTYELGFFRSSNLLHEYFEKALIPALNRQGINEVGVFEEYGEALPKRLYLVIPYKDIVAFQNSGRLLEQDADYLAQAETYLSTPEASMPFTGFETDLIQSSHGFPKLKNPGKEALVYELRIYTSHNERAFRSKMKMFDDHEFPIFDAAGLEMVFFGKNIAGSHMPCLTYLIATENMEANKAGWSKFISHPEWKRIVQLQEFANNMNNIIRVFLKPLPYSQF